MAFDIDQASSSSPRAPMLNNPRGNEGIFSEAMHQTGIYLNGEVIADGQIHRFPTGNKNNRDGWYIFYSMAGAFGDWSRDIRVSTRACFLIRIKRSCENK